MTKKQAAEALRQGMADVTIKFSFYATWPQESKARGAD